ncbi:MAG: 3-methyl-2-oxobutanoate hydroxymethyltransferase [Gemmatimonadaceae bacterium]
MSSVPTSRGLTVRDIREKKGKEPIVVVTAYDVLFGRLVDQAGVDVVLVGDSLGNVVAGFKSTLQVTLDDMIHHGAAVCRGVSRALVTVDMPFMSYQISSEQALANCGRLLAETGAQAIKIEGGSERIAETVSRLVEIGIPVMGHLGFTPQSVNAIGLRVQGREAADAERLVREAKRLDEAGAFAVVLELIPTQVAARITASISAPTIGIGAGVECDGQVLVLPDLLGLNDEFAPKFLKKYANLSETVRDAVRAYGDDVRQRKYPSSEHSF